jgi:hypothetical protein
MGYSTDFEGEFRCRRVVATEIEMFLSEIETDVRTIGVFADWLEEHGDDRAAKLRGCKEYREAANLFHALLPEHAAYLLKFSQTRRMKRDPELVKTLPDPLREAVGLPVGKEAGYFVGGGGFRGQDHDSSVLDYNRPPRGQPGLWCHWIPNPDRSAFVWDGGEKFYYYIEWIEYLIKHFLGPWGYFLDGDVNWSGEDEADQGTIHIRGNVVTTTEVG